MTVTRGRLLKAQHVERGRLPAGAAGSVYREVVVDGLPISGRVVKSAVIDAEREATARLERASHEAKRLITEAEQRAAALRDEARDVGRREAVAELATAWIKLRTVENARLENELDRTVELARAIAERLLGEALRLDPATVVALARQALNSASQANRVAIAAHPEDAAALRAHLASLSLEGAAVEIHPDPARARGSLLFDTDLGILDADLTIQLDRLARSLRDGFRS